MKKNLKKNPHAYMYDGNDADSCDASAGCNKNNEEGAVHK